MKSYKVALLAAVASVAMGGTAFAQDEAEPFALSFNVGAASDYVFRGISQTDENPQIYGGVDATIGGIGYAGVWVSNVDFNNSTDMEYDLYAGIKPTLGPVGLDLAVIYYGYIDSPKGSHQDYVEWKAAGSVPVGPGSIGAAIYYSDEFFGDTGNATYYEINGSAPIGETGFAVSGALGKQELKGPFDYTTWNVGVSYTFNDHFSVDLRYHDTDKHEFGDLYDSRGVVGVKAVF
jgi:uncharacterized protein (TIGR02001 family)